MINLFFGVFCLTVGMIDLHRNRTLWGVLNTAIGVANLVIFFGVGK